jgi:tetratricopeptide (TPR) repeat protein
MALSPSAALCRKFRGRLLICGLTVGALVCSVAHAQSKDVTKTGTLHGMVRDSQQHGVASATVHLQAKDGAQVATAITDANGQYLFPSLQPGAYNLRAELSAYDNATFGPLFLKPGETKRIDLTLGPAKSASPPKPSQPEFFDEPQFTVAGVSDTTNFGGHGSDTVVRTTETLAKETVSLGGASSNAAVPSSSTAAMETSLRQAVEQNPESFESNRNLGAYLVAAKKAAEGLPYLEKASRLNPSDDGNAYELALAYGNTGDYTRARNQLQALLTRNDKAELHHLLADIEEKQGHPVEAVREYQRAAELNASEPNYFDWGAELLMHSAVEPAIEVFSKGSRLYPRSSRMLMGLGVAQYGRGFYDQAVYSLCQASDLNPDDPAPYLFLGKLQEVDTTTSKDSTEKLARFVRLQPENALANYYYAVSLRRQKKGPDDTQISAQVESLLQRSVKLDPKLGVAFLQIGILSAERKDFSKAIPAYQKAIEASPNLEQAHYRLAQAYRQAGNTAQAQKELQRYEELSRETAEQVVRERRDIQQFVYTLRDGATVTQPQ